MQRLHKFGPFVVPGAHLLLDGAHTLSVHEAEHQSRIDSFCERNRDLVTNHEERLFLARHYFPETTGIVLNVGVEAFNSDDHMLLPDPENMRSIDVDPGKAEFGSPFGHTVGDFLDWRSDEMLGAVVLFGCIGHRNARDPSEPHMEMEEADRIVRHAAGLLRPGGSLLLGVELHWATQATRKRDERSWVKWSRKSAEMRSSFSEPDCWRGPLNLIIETKRL